ncbi:hypothetical protein F4553_003830 [Allocatelliglobosispora scoriae]|uniref:DUF4383 domain-containing protein n=1 Tax=Allocatelliglobosispora scoriae TaxID=643052 RepID=A0A841BUM4_9ACTN|nr:DUF4383 domain-containing protein [Allocatelliglobosispora scoriae]MBB5870451.1 hypothetical protein [Allocatelliglobosispora scoriae]
MASHLPVNHPLRPIYRLATAIGGVAAVVLGGAGLAKTVDQPLFDQGDNVIFGLVRVNLGHSLLMLAGGILLLLAVVIGRNVDARFNMVFGGALMFIGIASLAVMRTDANYLNFAMANVVIAFLLGSVLLTAGLYGKVSRA